MEERMPSAITIAAYDLSLLPELSNTHILLTDSFLGMLVTAIEICTKQSFHDYVNDTLHLTNTTNRKR